MGYCPDNLQPPQALSGCFRYHINMRIPFTKMHGLGNDFVVIDAITNPVTLTTENIRFLANRHFGIGCDQLLLLEPPSSPTADVNYRIFNADGGEVEQCGNGARCAAVYLKSSGQVNKDEIIAETANGVIKLYCQDDGQVLVDMGTPRLEPATIPIKADQTALLYQINVEGETLELAAVSMGNPHAVLLVENIDTALVEQLGPLLESHTFFPERVNVGFMQIIDRNNIRLRVFERGVGETLACGTGACAAVVAGNIQNLLESNVTVELPGGQLEISWAGEEQSVLMTGPATNVFEGVVNL